MKKNLITRMSSYFAYLLITCLVINTSVSSIAQTPNRWKTIFPFSNDVKQYTTEMLIYPTAWGGAVNPDGTAMAGTIYYSDDVTDAHYMEMHDLGAIRVSRYYNNLNRTGADPLVIDMTNMKVIDIEPVDMGSSTEEMLITCLSREHSTAAPVICVPMPCPWNGNVQRDYITILRTDVNGVLINSTDIWDDTDPIGELDYELYPTHTLYKEFTQSATNYKVLYICGTATTDEAALPLQPNYKHSKKAFLIAVDMDPNSGTYRKVLGNITFDYRAAPPLPQTPVPTPNGINGHDLDFDIAMHLDWITTGNLADNISISGSVNGFQSDPFNIPPDPNIEYNRSAAMTLVVDPVSLTVQADFPYMTYKEEEWGENEYSIGLMEYTDGTSTNRKHHLGNKFVVNETGDYPLTAGGMWINDLNANLFLLPRPISNMYRVGGNYWGTKVLPTYGTNPQGAQTANVTSHFLISGLQTQDCNFNDVPFPTNINAFLVDMHIDYTAPSADVARVTPNGNVGQWTTYTSNTGTGPFMRKGGGLSNALWYNTGFAARNFNPPLVATSDDEVIMYTPKYQPDGNGGNVLGFAFTGADNDAYDLPDAPWYCGPEQKCDPHISEERVKGVLPADYGTLVLIEEDANIFEDDYENPVELVCEDYAGPPMTPSYKPSVENIVAARETKIFPNPTTDRIYVDLSSTIEDDATIVINLINIHGQVVKELHNGPAENISSKQAIQLPEVSPGVYMITISSNQKTIHQEKLTIQ